jgi:protein FrlC
VNISLNTSSFTLHHNLEATLERSARLGFKYIEICGDRPHGWPEDIDKDQRKRLVAVAESFNMKIISVCTGFIYYAQTGFANWDNKVRDEGARYVKQLIDLASDLNAEILTLIPGRVLSDVSFDQAWNWSLEKIKECVSSAKERNIQLGLENLVNTNEFTNTSDRLLKMIKEVDDETLGITLDLGHVNVVKESMSDFIHNVADFLVNVHIDDNDGTGDAHLPPGKGNIDFKAAINVLREVDYKGCVTLEIAPGWHWTATETEKIVEESKKYMENLLTS